MTHKTGFEVHGHTCSHFVLNQYTVVVQLFLFTEHNLFHTTVSNTLTSSANNFQSVPHTKLMYKFRILLSQVTETMFPNYVSFQFWEITLKDAG